MELGLDCLGERPRGRAPVRRQFLRQRLHALLGLRERCRSGSERIRTVLESRQLGARVVGSGQELGVRLAPKAPLRLGDPIELGLDLLEPVGLGLERVQESPQLESRLAQAQLGVTELAGRLSELGCDRPHGGQGSLRPSCKPRGTFALLGGKRLHRFVRRLGELVHVPEPFPLAAQRILGVRGEAFGVLDERPQLGQPSLLVGSPLPELVMALAGSAQLAPGGPELDSEPELLLAGKRIEDIQLVGRPGQAALLELAGHRDQPLASSSEILARRASAPRVRARAPVGEHAPCEHKPFLALGP